MSNENIEEFKKELFEKYGEAKKNIFTSGIEILEGKKSIDNYAFTYVSNGTEGNDCLDEAEIYVVVGLHKLMKDEGIEKVINLRINTFVLNGNFGDAPKYCAFAYGTGLMPKN